MRRHLVLAAALVLAACQQDPPGTCASHFDCSAWQECSGGVCIAFATDHQVGSRCVRDTDCMSWVACVAGACTLAPGRCSTGADCRGWQVCDAGHACVTAAGFCGGEADCTGWQDCGTDHRCALTPGMCGTNVDCAAWELCGANSVCALAPNGCRDAAGCGEWQDCVAYRCATAAGHCAVEADCAAWQDCGADHVCALTPGMCGTASDCASWDVCDASHTCVHAAGYCASSADCAAWQACDALHACVTAPGYCATDSECAGWELCQPDHTCTTAPNGCATDADCTAWETCASYRCALAPGRCDSDADCVAPRYCIADNTCSVPSIDPGAVLLWGTLGEGMCGYGALAALDAPERPLVGFGCSTAEGMLSPTGEFVWEGDGDKVRRLVPDSFEWDPVFGEWNYPRDPVANDDVLLSGSCGSPAILVQWLMKGGTGELVEMCGGVWHDASGTVQFTTPSGRNLRVWNANEYKLLDNTSQNELYVMDPAGVETRVSIPISVYGYAVARTHGDGFRAVVQNGPTGALELWTVAADGSATHEGTYPAIPTGYTGWGRWKLDAAGALYETGLSPASTDIVIKRTVAPQTFAVVYDEANAPPPGSGIWYTKIHGSNLVSSP